MVRGGKSHLADLQHRRILFRVVMYSLEYEGKNLYERIFLTFWAIGIVYMSVSFASPLKTYLLC